MEYKSYQHIERLWTDATEGILNGIVYIFPKLDGTNGVLFKNGAGSRKRELSTPQDNQGFFNKISTQEKYARFFEEYPNVYLYGEYLKPHTVKNYTDDAWGEFYVFDIQAEDGSYIEWYYFEEMLGKYGIKYIPPIAILSDPTEEQVKAFVDQCTYLCEPNTLGEGIVVKNINFTNKYGRTVWAKVVRDEFKQKIMSKKKKAKVTPTESIEQQIVDSFCTSSFIEKEYQKLVEDKPWSSKLIPMLISKIYHEFIEEESWNFIKKYKNPMINFKVLNSLIIGKVKEVKGELF